jgi:predicted neutral ceramidase superfamily lipid hydrolase
MLANLRALFGVLLDIVLLRQGPDSLPGTREVFTVSLIAFLVTNVTTFALQATAGDRWPLHFLLSCVIMLLWYRLMLMLAQKRERYLQTISAIMLARAVFVPVVLPIALEVERRREALPPNTPPDGETSLIAFIGLILAVWMYVVLVRIVRSALEYPLLGSILVVVGEGMAALTMAVLLLGPPAAPPT